MTHPNLRYTESRRITLIGAVINFFLGVVKIIVGWIGSSQALIADGIHSLSDLLTDGLVIFAAKYGSRSADEDHPYGHGRIETAVTVVFSVLLALVGFGIIGDAVWRIIESKHLFRPEWIVIFVALISVLSKELLYRYTLRIAKKLRSRLLQANAWHHRSDALSSIVVLIGVLGAHFGLYYLDGIAAIIVGFMIVKMGWELGWSSIQELVDTGLDKESIDRIHDVISNVPGVVSLHQLRTRTIAGEIFVDVHILVAPKISVSEGHHIGEQVHFELTKKVETISDVIVHIDPEDDEIAPSSLNSPNRRDIEKELDKLFYKLKGYDKYHTIQLHYLNGKVCVELYLSIESLKENNSVDLKKSYEQIIANHPYLASIQLFFQ